MQAPSSTAPAERAVADVDLDAVAHNCALLKDRLGDAELCAVVKADGYGHGAVACARATKAGGAGWLAVATAAEAEQLRRGGIAGPVLAMGALTAAETERALRADADVVAWRRSFVDQVARITSSLGLGARLHVKLDTGMGRLGTPDPGEALALVDQVAAAQRLELAGFMTHFATADELDSDYFGEQLARFAEVVGEVKRAHSGCILHAANSAAVFREPASHFDMARCGIAVYGLDPFQGDPAERGLRPALTLRSYVAALRPVLAGDTVGYGRTWTAGRDTVVATLPIGYGDGYRRGLGNRAEALVRGRRMPVVGTISMDNITVDTGADGDVEVGDAAVLIGGQGSERVLAEELARILGTINYEITCGIAQRVPRVHRGAGADDER